MTIRKGTTLLKILIATLIITMTCSVTVSFAETDANDAADQSGTENAQQTDENKEQQGQTQTDTDEQKNENNKKTDQSDKDEKKNQKIKDETKESTEVDDTKDDNNKKKKTDKENKDSIKGNTKQAKKDIKKAIKQGNLNKEDEAKVLDLEDQIGQIELEMAALEAKLKEIDDKIQALEKKEKKTKRKINARQGEMNDRLRTMYKSGSVGFVDVVLNSENISDVIDNVYMVKRLYKSDRNAIKTLRKNYKSIQKEEEELKEARKEQKETYASQLEKMEAQSDAILASALIFANLDGKYSGGKLLWPVPSSTRISSKFGYRICPFHGRELHRGIDIPTYTGAPIIAAYDGTVVRSTYSSGYGNYVMIAHGGGLATLYAHNSSLVAKVGQTVKRGDVIAKAGSTGPSTGTHCHFEVQMNGELADPMGFFK